MEELAKLTQVPIERQKLMARRLQLKPESIWKTAIPDLKDGMRFMLIGTAEKPTELIDERDDQPEEAVPEESKKRKEILMGLHNYGNTCYMNAVFQTLRLLPDFREFCKAAPTPATSMLGAEIASFFQTFPRDLLRIVTICRKAKSVFAAKDPTTDQYKQQDASEFWIFLLTELYQISPPEIDKLFQVHYKLTLTDPQNPEFKEIQNEKDFLIPCHIKSDTKQLEQGFEMVGEVEKENSVWPLKREIEALPQYLSVQLNRFCYKADDDIVAKVLRQVKHPMRLDMIPYVTQTLREELVKNREENKPNNGWYKLKAVLTHRGRLADSGHYVTHVKVDDQWLRFDDEKVIEIDEESVDMLCGSGDWHCSFIVVYERE